jgi:hypothetical protein
MLGSVGGKRVVYCQGGIPPLGGRLPCWEEAVAEVIITEPGGKETDRILVCEHHAEISRNHAAAIDRGERGPGALRIRVNPIADE